MFLFLSLSFPHCTARTDLPRTHMSAAVAARLRESGKSYTRAPSLVAQETNSRRKRSRREEIVFVPNRNGDSPPVVSRADWPVEKYQVKFIPARSRFLSPSLFLSLRQRDSSANSAGFSEICETPISAARDSMSTNRQTAYREIARLTLRR